MSQRSCRRNQRLTLVPKIAFMLARLVRPRTGALVSNARAAPEGGRSAWPAGPKLNRLLEIETVQSCPTVPSWTEPRRPGRNTLKTDALPCTLGLLPEPESAP